MTLEAIKYRNGQLEILNVLKLPHESVYEEIKDVKDGWVAIKKMKVRGAPAIAIVGCLSLAVELREKSFETSEEIAAFIEDKLKYLVTSRPTAVNLGKQASSMIAFVKKLAEENKDAGKIKQEFIQRVEQFLQDDLSDNKSVGKHGCDHILNHCKPSDNNGKFTVLTHCNTGSLATAGYGTALGVIRSLHSREMLQHAYCTETRPYNQGARLTAYELVFEKIPGTLICDNMAGLLMKTKKISAVVVGADRVAKNGDVANKIGTYQLAVLAKYHGIPFYVAAPFTSIDKNTNCGDDIEIEFRNDKELTTIAGVRVAADGIGCWNPAFDVTPFELVTGGIITERGVLTHNEISKLI